MSNATERIHVVLARQGVGSRREIEGWIKKGYIAVNDKPARLGQKIDLTVDRVKVRGKALSLTSSQNVRPVALILHKPRGVVTTLKDPQGRRTVSDLVPTSHRLFPVGRLDYNSEGLLLMTNDGELAQRLTHPRYEVSKTYEVKIRGNLDESKIQHLKLGVKTGATRFKGAEILSVKDVTSTGVKKYEVCVRIYEGQNREVRKMFEALRCRVIRLKRVAMGKLQLKGVPYGGYRFLSPVQIRSLRSSVGL